MGILSAFPGKTKPRLQNKTATPSEKIQNIMADSEYDGLGTVTVEQIPSAYVRPSTTLDVKTWTPGFSEQSIPAGTYLSGRQTILGDSNLLAKNIKSGVEIFGVTGTMNPVQASIISADGETITISGVNASNTNPTVMLYNRYSLDDIEQNASGGTGQNHQCVLGLNYTYGADTYRATTFYIDVNETYRTLAHNEYTAGSSGDFEIEFSYENGEITLTIKGPMFLLGDYIALVY